MAQHYIENVEAGSLDLQERVVEINRVAKVVKGGRRFSFTALVVVGDEDSVVGVGYGKANEVPLAIQKGVDQAKKNLFRVPKYKTTVTHRTDGRFGAAHVMLKPAAEGVGVIAGGGVRAVLELAGIHDILAKSLGSQNPINLVKATIDGLQSLRRPEELAELRGLTVHEVLGLEPRPQKPEDDAAPTEAVAPAADTEAPSADPEPAAAEASPADATPEATTDTAAEPVAADADPASDPVATEPAATEPTESEVGGVE